MHSRPKAIDYDDNDDPTVAILGGDGPASLLRPDRIAAITAVRFATSGLRPEVSAQLRFALKLSF